MTKTKKQVVKAKGTRTAGSPEYKAAALARAEQIGVGAAARELGINESQLYRWKQRGQVDRQRESVEQLQAAEIARLKRALADRDEELAIVKKAAAYFGRFSGFGPAPHGASWRRRTRTTHCLCHRTC